METVWEQLVPPNFKSINPKLDFPPQQPSRFNSRWEHGKHSGIIGNTTLGLGLGWVFFFLMGFADSLELIKVIQEQGKS